MAKKISNIVFTKNRPLQLDGYLESLYRYLPEELIQTYIIYKVELFEQEYEQLFEKYPSCVVIKEEDFSSDFSGLLDKIDTDYILFGIDDVVCFDFVDFDIIDETFSKYARDIFGFSLRFSEEGIRECGDTISEAVTGGQAVYRVNWKQGRTPSTRYPFELCATIYQTHLVKRIISSSQNNNILAKKLFSPKSGLIKALGKITSVRPILKSFGYFYNPNTLESWNCRWCQRHSDELPNFIYFQKQCACAVQVNMVNVTERKIFNSSFNYTVEALAAKYKQGYRLDIDYIAKNKPRAIHCGPEYFKLIRNEAVSNV
ncbi:MAG: hypothetical protein JSV82_03295 [Planctomycetota bacterium]|nr:MAG: hypothetical protein JSV82_03295 [Planctomycetota bacterium]